MGLSDKLFKTRKEKVSDILSQVEESKAFMIDSLPVSYVVFEYIYDEHKEIIDLRYLYVNEKYEEMTGYQSKQIIGKLFSEVFPGHLKIWLPTAKKVAKEKTSIKDIIYGTEIQHWLSFVASPTMMDHSISFVFITVDDEITKQNNMEKSINTDHFLVEVNKAFDSDLSFEESIKEVLEETSHVIHPDRINIVEKNDDDTYSSTYEWFKEGLSPELDNCQNRPFEHFKAWNEAVRSDIYIDIPDVQEFDFNQGQKDYFKTINVKRLILLPLYNNGKVFGFVTIYNPHPDQNYDLQSLMTTWTYIISSSLTQHNALTEFEHFSKFDALTNIYSRYGFTLSSHQYMKDNPGQTYTLAVMDIDEFKFINDLYGHHLGDEILKFFAKEIREAFATDCIFGRTGGDEFCVLFKSQTMDSVVGKLNEFSTKHHVLKDSQMEYEFTISIGCAEYPSQSQDASKLFSLADAALYAVKLHGKNGCQVYNEHLALKNRSLLGFGLKDISGNIPCAIMVYQKEGEKILYANNEAIHLFECQDVDELIEIASGSFKGLVHPSDYRRVRESIDQQIIENHNDLSEFVKYRIFTKNGLTKEVMEFGRLTRSNYYGDVYYILLVDQDMLSLDQDYL